MTDAARAEIREINSPLRQEMNAACQRVTLRQAEILRGSGVPVVSLIGESLIGITTAEIDRGDYWVPCDTGKTMIVTPLHEDGCIVDLIAFEIGAPDIWYLRTGAGWALNSNVIRQANMGWDADQYIDLHATPLDWLRSNATGACVTQWTPESRAAVRQIHGINVVSNKFARALRLELTRPPRIPEIEVKGNQSRAA